MGRATARLPRPIPAGGRVTIRPRARNDCLAPQGNEPAFAIAQLVVAALFFAFGWRAVQRFHPAPTSAPVTARAMPS